MRIKKETWYLIFAYKNPKVNNGIFLDKVKSVYETTLNKAKEIILIGDLNIDTLLKDNELTSDLCDIYGLDDLIKDPTCFKKQEGTLIS